jgi:hypothetical protein
MISRGRILAGIVIAGIAAGSLAAYTLSRDYHMRPEPAVVVDRSGRRWLLADLAPGTRLEGAILRDARWRSVRLTGVKLVDCDMRGADLRDADLRDAVLLGTNLSGARLDGADLRGAWWATGTVWPDEFNPLLRGVLPDDSPLPSLGGPPRARQRGRAGSVPWRR